MTGQGWSPVASPTKGALGSVFVVSEDEIYACGTGNDHILAGALDSWERRGPFDLPLHCVAKRFDQLWVGTGRSGLRRLDPGATELTPVKPAVVTYHFDAREELLFSGDAMFAATANGKDFIGQPIAAYVELAGSWPPSWR